jgi:hypothetical protein
MTVRRMLKVDRRAIVTGLSIALASFGISAARADWDGPILGAVEGGEEFWLATDAYIYGYPLVTMEMTRRVVTNVVAPEGTHAPMGQLIKLRQYPNASFKDVTAPNAETLYTTSFIDVGKEPWVISIPDMKERYYLLPMLDGWTNVFQVPGKRTTPTSIVWILGRTYCTGTPEDYAAVHAAQDEFKLVPLSSYGKPYTPPAGTVDLSIDMKMAVREQVNRMSAVEYFTLLAQLMKSNPPAAEDAPELARFAKIGLVPSQDFDASKLNADFAKRIPEVANDRIMIQFKINKAVKDINGFAYTTKTGLYGTDYLMRALVTAIGVEANRPEDAVYPTSQKDANGDAYNGANKYVMHFDKGQLPPAKGFWSLTMYNSKYFFVENPLNRYSISARQDLKPNADGSVDLYIQNESPGADKESNWLPAPPDKFILMLRLYWPNPDDPSILDGSWTIPAVKKPTT